MRNWIQQDACTIHNLSIIHVEALSSLSSHKQFKSRYIQLPACIYARYRSWTFLKCLGMGPHILRKQALALFLVSLTLGKKARMQDTPLHTWRTHYLAQSQVAWQPANRDWKLPSSPSRYLGYACIKPVFYLDGYCVVNPVEACSVAVLFSKLLNSSPLFSTLPRHSTPFYSLHAPSQLLHISPPLRVG